MKNFTTHNSTEIPPVAMEGFNCQNQLSDDFYGLVKTIGGESTKSIVRYDHYRNRWLISRAGCVEVIEYYKENKPQ